MTEQRKRDLRIVLIPILVTALVTGGGAYVAMGRAMITKSDLAHHSQQGHPHQVSRDELNVRLRNIETDIRDIRLMLMEDRP